MCDLIFSGVFERHPRFGEQSGPRIGMDSLALRGFVGIDLGREPVPDETTVCRFRHLVDAAHIP